MSTLDPSARELLLDALRPASGTRFEAGVGTSFSVDLDALLLTPLAFARFDLDGAKADPGAILAAVQRHAERLALYCDAAHVKAREGDRLYVLLESSLLPVSAPRGGAFHPKLWVLRYRDEDSSASHRILVLSRNLTFDRSWDLIVRLDEDPSGAPVGRSASAILGQLNRLRASAVTAEMGRSVRSARFAPPPPFQSVELHGVGFSDASHDPLADLRGERMLVMSPFLDAPRLRELRRRAKRAVLVSRGEELERLGHAALADWGVPKVLETPERGADEDPAGLHGLHAKLVVIDDGSTATWLVGSANATSAAIERNTEAVLELGGPVRRVGVRALLAQSDSRVTLATLLRDFPVENEEPIPQTPEELEEQRLEELAGEIARRRATLTITPAAQGYDAALRIDGPPPALHAGDRVRVRMVTQTPWVPATLTAPVAAQLTATKASELTALVQVEIAGDGPPIAPRRFVLLAELHGAPTERLDQLFLELISTPSGFIRMLFLLIAADDPTAADGQTVRAIIDNRGSEEATAVALGIPLYEALVRASGRDPALLRSIDQLISRLERTAEGRALIPEGFLDSWAAFRTVAGRST